MKNIIVLLCILTASCCGTKKSSDAATTPAPAGNETAVAGNENTAAENLPACLKELINGFAKEEKKNPPRKIFRYTYEGKNVYYVTAPCCDFFSDLYNSNCQLIGHPDGGITGRGDGKFQNFEKARSNEKLMWEDKRK